MNDKMVERQILTKALNHALEYLSSLEDRPVNVQAWGPQLKTAMLRDLQNEGIAAETVIDELIKATEPGILGSAGGRFFGWVIGGTLPAALAADWMVSTWDQNAALYACEPSGALVAEIAADWLKDLLHLPQHASTAFVTGCQMAHFTSLASARHKLMANHHWDVERAVQSIAKTLLDSRKVAEDVI